MTRVVSYSASSIVRGYNCCGESFVLELSGIKRARTVKVLKDPIYQYQYRQTATTLNDLIILSSFFK